MGGGADGGISACMTGLRCMMSMCAEIPEGGPPDGGGPIDAPIGQ
jgi:hypothetical protein